MKGSHGLTLVVAQDLHARLDENRTEWVWRGSQSLGASAELFAGEIYGECASGRSTARSTTRDNNRTLFRTGGGGGGYGTWISFDGNNNQVQDDPSRHDYNVDQVGSNIHTQWLTIVDCARHLSSGLTSSCKRR